MKKLLALAGIAASLLVMAPAAFADSGDRRGGHHYSDRGDRNYHRGHDRNRNWDRGHNRKKHHWNNRHDRRSAYRHMKRHNFSHWRRSLARYRYHSFGRPVFYDYYYRVPARDRFGRHITLTVNAYTGAIISAW